MVERRESSHFPPQISWVRIRDWHILTNGLVRFTTDDRFNVLYREGSFNWVLQVIISTALVNSLDLDHRVVPWDTVRSRAVLVSIWKAVQRPLARWC